MAGHRPEKNRREDPAIRGGPGKSRLSPGKTEQGFTLLELMASIAILGLGIVTAIRLFSGGLGLAKASGDYTGKVLVAKEKMTGILLAEKISEGVARGTTDDGFSWTVEIGPYDGRRPGDGEAGIFKIVVRVDGPQAGKNTFTLTTLKTVF